MKKFLEKVNQIILILFISIFVWTILCAILDYDKIIYDFNPVILVLGIVAYIFIIKLFYKKVIPKLENIKILPVLLLLLFTVTCLIVAYKTRLGPDWDMGIVFSIARDYSKTGDMMDVYLYKYPHNIMITVIFTILFKIFSFIPNVDYVILVTIFNSLIVSGTVVIMYLIARKILDKRKSLLLLFIVLFTTPLYLHAAIYYTDAISAFFATLMLYLYLLIDEKKEFKKKIIFELLLGVTLFVGMKVKVTASFIVIAILVYNLLNLKIKETIKNFCIVLPVFLILLVIFTVFINSSFDKNLVNQYKMPVEHWIMMGLKGSGIYDSDDYAYTTSYETYEERKKVDIEEIKRRIDAYDGNSFIKHITEKLKFTWTDGTYFAPVKISRSQLDKGLINEIILGKYSNIYKYIPQVMHLSMLIFIVINAWNIFKSKNFRSKNMILLIAMFGITVFLLIWENRSRYIVTLLPIMMILQLNGIENNTSE